MLFNVLTNYLVAGIKFDDTKPRGAVESLDGRGDLQEIWSESRSITNHIKSNKCQILHTGQGNHVCTEKLGGDRLVCSSMKSNLSFWVDDKLNMSQGCAKSDSQKGELCRGVHQAQHCWPVKGLVTIPFYTVLVGLHTPSRVLRAVLGTSI